MHRQRAGQKPEPAHRGWRTAGARHAALEPAHGPGTQSRQHSTAAPRGEQQAVEFVCAPEREHVAHRAAADVHHVLLEHDLLERLARVAQAKQRQVLGHAGAIAVTGEKGVDLRGLIARGGRQEEDARALGGGQLEHEVI